MSVVERDDPLLTSAEAAAYLRDAERHLRHLKDRGELPFVNLGRKVRFLKSDLDAYIERNRHDSATT